MQKFKEATLCRLCLETVTNSICADCLFEDVQSWLLHFNRADLLIPVFNLHERIGQIIQNEENLGVCVVCRRETNRIACPCCYLFEIYSLFRAVKVDLSKEFEKNFNFDFSHHHGYSQLTLWQTLHSGLLSRDFKSVIIFDKREKHDMNICDNCDQISEDLIEQNGEWVCESCRE